jgi:Nucleotide-diphospho-sugar transferase
MDFVMMADHGYVNWLELSLPSVSEFHKDSRIFVYDLSDFSSGALQSCLSKYANTAYVHYPPEQWRLPDWVNKTDFSWFYPYFGVKETIKYMNRRLRYLLTGRRKDGWIIDKAEEYNRKQHILRVVCQKPHVIADALNRSGNDVVFIDADAATLGNLNHVFDKWTFDAGVTVVDREKVKIGLDESMKERQFLPYSAINVGVMFFRNSNATKLLIDAWISEMEDVHYVGAEQTALANLIYKADAHAFEVQPKIVVIAVGQEKAKVLMLPCRDYNYHRLSKEDCEIPERTYVVHFVGSLKLIKNQSFVRALLTKEIEKRTSDAIMIDR